MKWVLLYLSLVTVTPANTTKVTATTIAISPTLQACKEIRVWVLKNYSDIKTDPDRLICIQETPK